MVSNSSFLFFMGKIECFPVDLSHKIGILPIVEIESQCLLPLGGGPHLHRAVQ